MSGLGIARLSPPPPNLCFLTVFPAKLLLVRKRGNWNFDIVIELYALRI